MRDLFSQCMYVHAYVSVTLRNVNLHSCAHRGTHASCALSHEDTGYPYMPSLTIEDREERHFLTIKEG